MKATVGSERILKFLLTGLLLCPRCAAPPYSPPRPRYAVRVESNVRVAMRDGVQLATDLYFPIGTEEKLPGILVRTPYDRKKQSATGQLFAAHGYVVGIQDVRGKFDSEGTFILSAADTNDGADTITWMAAQPWSTGKIGTYGCSYLGEDQIEVSKLRLPQHAAMIPQAAGGAYRYAAFVEGGALELAGTAGWFNKNGSKVNPAPKASRPDIRPLYWTLPVIEILKKAGAPPTDYEGWVSHGPGDPWWDQFGYVNAGHHFNVPAIHLSSWYDTSVNETLELFNLLRANSVSVAARQNQFVIIAPTTHCKWETATEHTIVGEMDMGDAQLDYLNIYLRWFDHWLKGIDNGATDMPKVRIYVMGSNHWREAQEWPLPGTRFIKYFLHSDGHANSRSGTGELTVKMPGEEPADHFTYDPAEPVPTLGDKGPEDERLIEDRPDVLVYSTPPLERGVEVTGPLQVALHVSSSAKDTDFTAKLLDVDLRGKALNLQEAILRARYRGGYGKQVWMQTGEVYPLTMDLHATSNYFAPGHRIRLELSSSNFPRFDRNLNTGGNNYDEVRWVVARNAVHHSRRQLSYVLLPIVQ